MFYDCAGSRLPVQQLHRQNIGRAQSASPHEDSIRHVRGRKVDHSQRSFVSIIVPDPAGILPLDDPYRSIFALTDA